MKVRFVTQPYDDGTDLRDFLNAVANDGDLDVLRVIVAWAKRSGLGRAVADLATIRTRGAKVLAIVGVSEGGATEQGLRDLLDQTDEARVFHDRERTFHPKVYLAESAAHALLLVGSHNLTAGGMAWNYEAGVWLELDRTDEQDEEVRDDVVAYFDRLRADDDVCVPLTSENLSKILADPALLIQDEDVTSSVRSSMSDAPADSDSIQTSSAAAEPGVPHVFGKSKEHKRTAPPIHRSPTKKPLPQVAPASAGVSAPSTPLTVVRRWFRTMDGTAAQHPPGPKSKRTGNLRLTQEAFAIDHKKYFRDVFFTGLDWRPQASKADTEETWVSMLTTIAGDHLGEVDIRISHALKRVSNQNNVPTVLHWGALGARLRQNNYVGLTVTLERGNDDRFALTIADGPTGTFAY